MAGDRDRIIHRVDQDEPGSSHMWVLGLVFVLLMFAAAIHPGIPLP